MIAMAGTFDKIRLNEVLDAITGELGGEWLLLGGALVATWLDERRTTEDIDIVAIESAADDRLRLMRLAEKLGLPVEAVNSAADFFVRKVPDWRVHLEPFRRGARGVIYRPTPTLFVLLKMRRLSATDLDDCAAMLSVAAEQKLAVDVERLQQAFEALAPTDDPGTVGRRSKLRALLTTH